MRKRIKKFQNPGGGGITAVPGTWNSGFSLSQLMGYLDMALKFLPVPQIGELNFQQAFPKIDMAANMGDLTAMQIRSNHNFRLGLLAILEAAKLKNPFNGAPLEVASTARSGSDGGLKTPFFLTKGGLGVIAGALAVEMVGNALSSSGFADYKENGNTELRRNLSAAGRQTVLTMFPGWGHVIAAADSLVEGLGGKSDASEGLGTANDVGNMVASIALPGLGWALKKTDKYSQSEEIKKSASYTNEADAGEKVAKNAGAKLLFGRGKANDATRALKLRDINTEGVLADAKDAFLASNYGGISLGNLMTLAGGIKPLRVREGAKLKLLDARKILNESYAAVKVEEFREGGKVNVIPGGHLHKNKHHMEDVGEEYKDLTTKGIPVVTEGEGGALVQQAEIERDEIIFNLDVTKKLEELMEDGSDDAALEAGKLLTIEIMENTIDNTGLMKEIS